MKSNSSSKNSVENSHIRTLKIESDGDSWRDRIRPKIRLVGHWLERAGFRPGTRVHVTCVAPGVIELRSVDSIPLNELKQESQNQPECPF